MNSQNIFLEIRQLVKTFGYRDILQNATLAVYTQRINILSGPNGVGKSTLLNVLCGIAGYSAGSFWHFGSQVQSPRDFQSYIAYLSSKLFLYDDLTVIQNIRFFGGLKTGSVPAFGNIREYLAAFNLSDFQDFPIRHLSTGMIKKTAIICALIQNPKLLILDEPFASLDVETCALLTDRLDLFCAAGGTVLMTTHQEMPATKTGVVHYELRAGIVKKKGMQ